MSAKALKYAEEKLGVHLVYNESLVYLQDLDEVFSDLDKAQDRRRQLMEQIADREAELLSEERGMRPDMSATGMDQHMKSAKRTDSELRNLRDKLNETISSIQGLELDSDLLKARLKVSTARLNELGGYLHYLAAVKAEHQRKTQEDN
jgi:hypothetical protein